MLKRNFEPNLKLANRTNFRAQFSRRFRFLALLATALACGGLARASQTVTLAWNPSPDLSAVGYAVYYGSSSGNYTNRIDVGNSTMATVTGLTAGQTNYFTIAAYNAFGIEGARAGELTYMVPGLLHLSAGATRTAPMSLSFATAPGHWYQIQASVDLKSWTNLMQTSPLNGNYWISIPDAQSTQLPKRFYRLVQH